MLPLVGFAPPPFSLVLVCCCFLWGGGVSCHGFVVSVACCPGLGSRGLCPPIPSLPGCVVCLFFRPSVVCVRVFWVSLFPVGRCPRLGVAGFGWVVTPCPFGGSCLPCRLGGGFGRLLRCWWAVSWLWAALAPPHVFIVFFGGGGLPVPPSAFPGLAQALVGIQCGLLDCCWWLRFARPCPEPMGRVGNVHVGLGAPSCQVRLWFCRLGGCIRRLRVALR